MWPLLAALASFIAALWVCLGQTGDFGFKYVSWNLRNSGFYSGLNVKMEFWKNMSSRMPRVRFLSAHCSNSYGYYLHDSLASFIAAVWVFAGQNGNVHPDAVNHESDVHFILWIVRRFAFVMASFHN